MSPSTHYQQQLSDAGFSADPAQLAAVSSLQNIYDQLSDSTETSGLFQRKRHSQVRGLYLWGGVGRGKTWLMDAFYDCLPGEDKTRRHFHRFMRDVHEQLNSFSGRRNPLEDVAKELRRQAKVICFDEFFVSDITDAMILGTLFDALFRRGITLVATSNIPPVELYRDGLQRSRFLPTIDLLQQHCEILHVDGDTDYRLRHLEQQPVYYQPLNTDSKNALKVTSESLIHEHHRQHEDLYLNGRAIPVMMMGDGVVWFDFESICDGPRSQHDYIDLARTHHSVLISGIPQFDGSRENQARRFINLVDEFYDHNVKLIVSAAVPLTNLYVGQRLAFEFQRTESRLLEMQSRDYLARPHIP